MPTIGRYQISETLGQGGMGTVYKAFDPLLARVVAVKVISTQLGGSPEHHERFFREARAAAHLSHRNIITIHDLGEENGTPFLAMEFLEGRDLDKRMRSGEGMQLARKLEIALGACDGLAHAHACGVIHRDIKPANIFITDSGEVKILDFGLARLVTSEITRSNVMLGTVNYMAPEQIRAEKIDHRVDIFSFGVVLYELLSGRKAFVAESFASTLYKILQDVPEPLERISSEISPQLATVVERAMAKAREDRYQRVPDLARDLEAVYAETHGADPRFVRGWDSETRQRASSRTVPADVSEAPTMAGEPTPAAALTPPGSERITSAASGTPTPVTPPPSTAPAAARRRWLTMSAAAVVVLVGVALGVRSWRAAGPGAVEHAPGTTVPAPPVAPVTSAPAASASPEPGVPARPVPSMGQFPPPPDDTGAIDRARITRANREARTALGAEHYPEASRLISEVLRADPANRDALQLRTRLTAELLSRADRALADMDASKRAAVAAGASASAADLLAAAERSEAAARQSYADQQYADAAARSVDARALFRDAEGAARRHAAADAERARAAEVEPRTAERQDPRPLPQTAPSVPPDPALPAAPAGPPAEQVVAGVVERYVAALEQRDVAALREVWPGLGGTQEAAIRADFDNARSIEVGFRNLAIDVSGATATATGVRRYVLRTRDGHRLQSDTVTTVLLRRNGAQWVIDSIRHQPAR